jgi:hypothetical protein
LITNALKRRTSRAPNLTLGTGERIGTIWTVTRSRAHGGEGRFQIPLRRSLV